VPDPGDQLGRHPGVDELGQPAVRGEHAQRRVAGADQLTRRFGDAVQHYRQGQAAIDHLGGAQEAPQPPLRGHDLLGPLDQLAEELIQFHAREVGEGQLGDVVRHGRPRGASGRAPRSAGPPVKHTSAVARP
jgi:hypothetical protein